MLVALRWFIHVAGAFVTAHGAADPGVGKTANYISPVPLGDGCKLPLLVLDGLLCRGHGSRNEPKPPTSWIERNYVASSQIAKPAIQANRDVETS
jgi:hypothetical protein